MAIDIEDHNLQCETHNTYNVFFYMHTINTTVTHDPAVVSDWISTVEWIHRRRLHKLIVGLDVEWRPSYSRYQNPVATVQLCVGRRCLIYQIIHSPYVPAALADFLSDQDYTFVGVGVNSDLEKLENDYGIGGSARAAELGTLAVEHYGWPELRNAGLKQLAVTVFGAELEKPRSVTMSNWDNRWLTNEQVQYACVDAFVSFEIARHFSTSD